MFSNQQRLEFGYLIADAYNLHGQRQGAAGWQMISIDENEFASDKGQSDTGLKYQAYKNAEGKYVISIAGTDFGTQGSLETWRDLVADAGLVTGKFEEQFKEAIRNIKDFIQEERVSPYDITFVGHSLGGAQAQILAETFGGQAYTYDSPGVLGMLQHENLESEYKQFLASEDIELNQAGAGYIENWVEDGSLISAGGHFFEPQDYLGSVIEHNLVDNTVSDIGWALLGSGQFFGVVILLMDIGFEGGSHDKNVLIQYLQELVGAQPEIQPYLDAIQTLAEDGPYNVARVSAKTLKDIATEAFVKAKDGELNVEGALLSYLQREVQVASAAKELDDFADEKSKETVALRNSISTLLSSLEQASIYEERLNEALRNSVLKRVELTDEGIEKFQLWAEDDISLESLQSKINEYTQTWKDELNNLADNEANFLVAAKDNAIVKGEDGDDVLAAGDFSNALLNGGLGNDILLAGEKGSTLSGERGEDVLIGQEGNDRLLGGSDRDILIGGAGQDLLDGGEGDDRLEGGTGFDTYFAGAGDTIADLDNDGKIFFDGRTLSGGVYARKEGENVFLSLDGKFTYRWSGNTLVVNDELTIENFTNGAMGIWLRKASDKDDPYGNDPFEPPVAPPRPPRRTDPLVLDLNGDGISTIKLNEHKVNFDLDNNGLAELSAWVNAEDGFLVRDINQDGFISNGSELFSNYTQLADGQFAENGFAALSDLDSNQDGVINIDDSAFAELKIWQDKNSDGISQADELFTLSELGINALSVDYILGSGVDDNGIEHVHASTFTFDDGRSFDMEELWFEVDPADSVPVGYQIGFEEQIPDDIAALPDVIGFGNLTSLHLAMLQDESGHLKQLVEQFVNASFVERQTLLTNILHQWAGVNHVDPDSRGEFINAQDLAVMEKLWASPIEGEIGANYARILQQNIESFSQRVYSQLMAGTKYGKLIYQDASFVNGAIQFNLDNSINALQEELAAGASEDIVSDFMILAQHIMPQTRDYLFALKEVLNIGNFAASSNFKMQVGSTLNNTLIAVSTSNVLFGMEGDDVLHGKFGQDTFIFRRGDGQDTIIDTNRGANQLVLGTGIDESHLSFVRDGQDIILQILDNHGQITDDSIRFKEIYGNASAFLGQITFANGEVLKGHKLSRIFPAIEGGGADDQIQGEDHSQFLKGLAGNDSIIGGRGDDVLAGGTGNDMLSGGNGDDLYIFNRGDGSDVISETGGGNTLAFGDGIKLSNLRVENIDGSLQITLLDEQGNTTGDKIFIQDGLSQSARVVRYFEFTDGQRLHIAKLAQYIGEFQGTDSADEIIGGLFGDSIFGGAGDDIISGLTGDDTLSGDTGNDYLFGGEGNDTYLFNRGDGRDVILEARGRDNITFGGGITKESLIFKIADNRSDLILVLKDADGGVTSDQITIRNFYSNTEQSIESFIFNDGSSLSHDEIITLVPAISGSESDDDITASVFGGDVYGNAGNDIIRGTSSNNIFHGGQGDDHIISRGGYDVFVFGRGDGRDTIEINEKRYSGGSPFTKILLGNGIQKQHIKFSANGENTVVTLLDDAGNETSDSITLVNDLIASIELADGTVITQEEIYANTNTYQGTEGRDVLKGNIFNNVLFGRQGNDVLDSNNGDDHLYGGAGNDVLKGGGGNDTYYFNRGDGKDNIIDNHGINELHFGPDITMEQLHFAATSEGRVIISLLNSQGQATEDTITIGGASNIKNLVFADGTKVSTADFSDKLSFSVDRWNRAYGSAFGAVVTGSDADDHLYLGYGNNIVHAGKGQDDISARDGSNTFTFNAGDGHDSIGLGKGQHKIIFGNDIRREQVQFVRISYYSFQLIILDDNGQPSGDSILIRGGLKHLHEDQQFITFTFSDGTEIESPDIYAQLVIQEGGEEADNLRGRTLDDVLYGLGGNDTLFSGTGNDKLYGGDGDDELISNEGNNLLDGGAGDDNLVINWTSGNNTLYGGDGNDTLTYSGYGSSNTEFNNTNVYSGGKGNDIIRAGKSRDSFLFARGDGEDVIQDIGGVDKIVFAEGISAQHLSFQLNNSDIIITLLDDNGLPTSDQITVRRGMSDEYAIESIEFDDGTNLSTSQIKTLAATINGSQFDDVLNGTGFDEVMNGLDGNDQLTSHSGNDRLTGGKGNDSLYGGYGDDIYIFNLGDGQDVISDTNGTDTLAFGQGINRDNLRISKLNYNDLLIQLLDGQGQETGDQIILKESFRPKSTFYGRNIIEKLLFADGSSLQHQDLLEAGINIQGDAGDNRLNGSEYDEILAGGTGNDELFGGQGNDTYIFNIGDGQDRIHDEAGTDKVLFGEGITQEQVKFISAGYNRLAVVLLDDNGNETNDRIIINGGLNRNGAELVESFEFSDGSTLSFTDAITKAANAKGTQSDDLLYGTDGDDRIEGLEGDDDLDAGKGNDQLTGGQGDDKLFGGAGDDRLFGGSGKDYLAGGLGQDTYVFNIGDGQDQIVDDGGFDQIGLGEGITREHISVSVSGSEFVLTLLDDNGQVTTDRIRFNRGFNRVDNANQIEKISFADGTSLNADEILKLAFSKYANDAGGRLNGSSYDDYLYGKQAADFLYGYQGNDTLEGGQGNDYLYGGQGDDSYLFKRGDGSDLIDESSENGGTDTIKLGEGISREQIKFVRNDKELIIHLLDEQGNITSDKITVRNAFVNGFTVEKLEFENGDVLDLTSDEFVASLVNTAGTNDDDILEGSELDDIFIGLDGDDIIRGYGGNDVITAGQGNDYIHDRAGNEIYHFNLGDGQDTIRDEQGLDKIQFGTGISKENLLIQKGIENYYAIEILILDAQGQPTGDSLTLDLAYLYAEYRIESLEFADGSSMGADEILSLAADNIKGTEQDDDLVGFELNETLSGLGGDDELWAGAGDDTLIGGTGHDSLSGGMGNDTYVFARGDGQDSIYENMNNTGDINKLRFLAGITPDDIYLSRSSGGTALQVQIKGSNDLLVIHDWFKSSTSNETVTPAPVQVFEFADGTRWSLDDIVQQIDFSITGSNDNDQLYGTNGDDVIKGLAGNDTLLGLNGDDLLIGGSGNDELYGGKGSDTYRFELGFGQDHVFETRENEPGPSNRFNMQSGTDPQVNLVEEPQSTDIIEFGEGILPEYLTVRSEGSDLRLTLDSGDSIIIHNWFAGNKIEQVKFENGQIITAEQLVTMYWMGSAVMINYMLRVAMIF